MIVASCTTVSGATYWLGLLMAFRVASRERSIVYSTPRWVRLEVRFFYSCCFCAGLLGPFFV